MNTFNTKRLSLFVWASTAAIAVPACVDTDDQQAEDSTASTEDPAASTETSIEALIASPNAANDAAPEAAAGVKRTYAFRATKNEYPGDSTHLVDVRVAVNVAFDNGYPTYVRGYAAVICTVPYIDSGSPVPTPCSFSNGLVIHDNNTKNFATTNTGSDGYYSAYTKWVDIRGKGCYTTRTTLRNNPPAGMRVGIHGKYFNVKDLTSGWYDPCNF